MISNILNQKLQKAKEAQREWKSLLHLIKPYEKDVILLFPGFNHECNLQGMRYLDTYMQRIDGRAAHILTVDPFVKQEIQNFSDNIGSIVLITEEQADRLITLYELMIFDNRFVVISLDKPKCRNSYGLVDYKGTTIEQLVAVGIYSIIPFRPLKENRRTI